MVTRIVYVDIGTHFWLICPGDVMPKCRRDDPRGIARWRRMQQALPFQSCKGSLVERPSRLLQARAGRASQNEELVLRVRRAGNGHLHVELGAEYELGKNYGGN